jgi:hypothetical protein
MRAIIILLCVLAGCAAQNQGRLNTVEVAPEVDTDVSAEVENDIAAEVNSAVEASLAKIEAVIRDQSQRISETEQKALLATSKIDNSTSDKWVNRIMAIGGTVFGLILVVLLGFSAPRWPGRKFFPED